MSWETLWSLTHLRDRWWEDLFMPIQRDSLAEKERGPPPRERERWSERATEDSGRKNSRTRSTRTDCYRTTHWHEYRPSRRCLFSAGRRCSRDVGPKIRWNEILGPKNSTISVRSRVASHWPRCLYSYSIRSLQLKDSSLGSGYVFFRSRTAIRDLAREESGEETEKARQREIFVKSLQSLLL